MMATRLAEAFVEVTVEGVDKALEQIDHVREGLEKLVSPEGMIAGAVHAGEALLKGLEESVVGGISSLISVISTPFRDAFHGLFEGIGIGEGMTLFDFMRDKAHEAFGAFADEEVAIAQVRAAVKSTGEAAGWSAEQIEALSSKAGQHTIFSKVQEMNASRRLLAFTNIHGDMFERALKDVTDMASVTGDLESTAFKLGKALEAPGNSFFFLAKMGVRFNDTEKEQIKLMVAANDVIGAQDMILKKVEKSWGGTAEEMSSTWKVLQSDLGSAVEELMSKIGSMFGGKEILRGMTDWISNITEHFDEFLERVSTGSVRAQAAFKSIFGKIGADAKPLAEIFRDLETEITGVATHFDLVWDVIAAGAEVGLYKVRDHFGEFIQEALVMLSAFANSAVEILAGTKIGSAFTSAFASWEEEFSLTAQANLEKIKGNNKRAEELYKQAETVMQRRADEGYKQGGVDPFAAYNKALQDARNAVRGVGHSPDSAESKDAMDKLTKALSALQEAIDSDKQHGWRKNPDGGHGAGGPLENIASGKSSETIALEDFAKHIQSAGLTKSEELQVAMNDNLKDIRNNGIKVKVTNFPEESKTTFTA